MEPVIVGGKIGCGSKEAMRFLGIGKQRFTVLKRRGIIKSLGFDWYTYSDLVKGIQTLQAERDQGFEDEEGQAVRGKVLRPPIRTAKVYLLPDKPGGRQRPGSKAGEAQG